MSKTKEALLNSNFRHQETVDDTDWNYEPHPIAIQGDGKKCYEVKSIKDDCIYKLWAHSYKEAIEMLPMIENF
jgi:hypothetical protein